MIRRLKVRFRSFADALRRGQSLDASMDEEMRFHIEMEAERLVRERGVGPREARRLALLAFGGLEKFKEAGRDVLGLRWLDTISLDVRLALRMLVRYRGLTLVGGFAMAVAIAIGATAFEAFNQILDPALPFEEGDRIVAVRFATPTPGSAERRVVHDFVALRRELRSIEHFGAFRYAQHNLVMGTASEPVRVAEMSASGFAIARTPPTLGRYLLPEDESPAAPAVVVIGYDAWKSRFASDPLVIGRTITLGGRPATVVGVMPEGFRFPLDHQYWIPFRSDPAGYARLQGPSIFLFGRLSPGITFEQAQAELTAFGQRAGAESPATHARLRPVVLPYSHEHLDVTDPFRVRLLRLAQIFVGLLSFVVAVNLSVLIYARTVTRVGEIAVRTALGASRRRILLQLFVEAFALSGLGALAGLGLAHAALVQLQWLVVTNGARPFWIDLELSFTTVAYSVLLAALAAVVMGVLPGLRATSGLVNTNLRELDTRSGSRLGAMWTTLIVAQVAAAIAILPLAVHVTWEVVRMGTAAVDAAADDIVVGRVAAGIGLDASERPHVRRRQRDLIARLEGEPGVSAVTFSSGVPGFSPGRLLHFDEGSSQGDRRLRYAGHDLGVDALDVALNLFDVYEAPLIAGRALTSSDLGQANAVIVNRAFVAAFLVAGTTPGEALGVRFRYVPPYERQGTSAGTSYQIVGVTEDFPRFPREPGSDGNPTVYHPASPGAGGPGGALDPLRRRRTLGFSPALPRTRRRGRPRAAGP
jgi:putative ABC transport system permease protein